MEKLVYGIIFFILIVGAVIGVAIFYVERDVGLSEVDLEKCEVLEENNENGIDIVFFGEDRQTALDYVNYFSNAKPFSKYGDRFNFYYIRGYYPLCEIYKDVAILCYSRELIKKAGSCPNDYIVVLNDEEPDDIRSSSYMNVMSLNAKHPKSVLIHEFGHAFVNLAEEYVPAKIPRNSAGNCVSDCSEFEGKNDGCYQGCSLAEYSRSVENGIMRTLRTDNYGKFNEWVVVNKIEKLTSSGRGITGSAVGDVSKGCREGEYYSIELEIEDADGRLNIKNRDIVKGCIGESGSGDYSFGYVTKDGESVELGEFNPLDIRTDLPEEGDAQVMMSGETYENIEEVYTDKPKKEGSEGGIEGGVEIRNPIPIIVKAKIPSDLEIEEVEKFEIKKNNIPIDYVDICKEKGKGDVNGDGVVDISDIAALRDYFDGKHKIVCLDNADVNGDGKTGIGDWKALRDSLFSEIRKGREGLPSVGPSAVPSAGPTTEPSVGPSATASASPSVGPSVSASASPTSTARASPTASASASASGSPSASQSPVSAVDGKSLLDRISGLITGWFAKIFGD